MEDALVWALGGLAGFLLLNRLLAGWALRRLRRMQHYYDMQRVIHGKEHQVKGRFD